MGSMVWALRWGNYHWVFRWVQSNHISPQMEELGSFQSQIDRASGLRGQPSSDGKEMEIAVLQV